MNVPIRQDVKRMRRILWGVAVVLVLSLFAYVGVRHHNATRDIILSVTWDGVPAVLDVAIRSSQYQDGGAYLLNPSLLNTANSMQRDAYSYRLAINFLRSLTPEQVDSFQRGQTLPFTKVSPDQQKALSQLASSRVEGYIPSHINESYIQVVAISADKQNFLFNWMVPAGNDRVGIMFDMSFSATGNARFPFPYRHL